MIDEIFTDSEAAIVSESFAVVYARGKKRKRFPVNCVTLVESLKQAELESDTSGNLHPAKVIGPSRSSEGLMLYYLVDWL